MADKNKAEEMKRIEDFMKHTEEVVNNLNKLDIRNKKEWADRLEKLQTNLKTVKQEIELKKIIEEMRE